MKDKVINYLKQSPDSKAKDIAKALGIEKSKINSLLYGKLNELVESNKQYEWRLKDTSQKISIDKHITEDKKPTIKTKSAFVKKFKAKKAINPNKDINKLSKYYLSCLGYDYDETSVFSSNKYGDLDYSEHAQSFYDDEGFDDNWTITNLDQSLSKDRFGRKKLSYGYPVYLNQIYSKKTGTPYYLVQPIFLFDINRKDNKYQIDKESISINPAIQNLFLDVNKNDSSLMNEIATLEDELGIAEKEIPDLSDIADRLRAIKPTWPWKESINLDSLDTEPPLKNINEAGIYNRAVIIKTDKSNFTQGLESELKKLSEVSDSDLEKSILYKMINNLPNEDLEPEIRDILAVMPMNLEQENAVKTSMNKSITVITGPPGTGKSQVVSNLLINLAKNNKKALFASKNNQAVDVVDKRVNGLGSRPILLRTGKGAYQIKILEYTVALLTSECTENDKRNYEKLLFQQKTYTEAKIKIEDQLDEIIKTRNHVDDLEQTVEMYRDDMSDESFRQLQGFNETGINLKARELINNLDEINNKDKTLFKKILWLFNKNKILDRTKSKVSELNTELEGLPLSHKPKFINENDTNSLYDFLNNYLKQSLEEYSRISNYLTNLNKLSSMRDLSEIYNEYRKVNAKLEKESHNLWKLWLKIQVGDQVEDRKALTDYQTALKMSNESEVEFERNNELKKKINDCKKKYASKIPCWAVTSLSAKGRIDFDSGIFDVVIFDEASQCDIASALPLLYRAKSAVIIGDPKQLTHISKLPRKQDIRLLSKHELSEKFISWAYSFNSLYDLMSGYVDNSLINLLDHHRSHKDIIDFSNKQFYENKLRIATNYDSLELPRKKDAGVRWVDVAGQAKRHNQGSPVNETEAKAVVNEIERLIIDNKYIGSIGVVTPFRHQANLINEIAYANKALSDKLIQNKFLVDTAHRFQGDERDIMIFSPVFSSGFPESSVRFLQSQGNIFNVAITRAKAQLITVGDLKMCSNCDIDYLKNFAAYTQSLSSNQANISEVTISDNGEEYPNVQNPESVSDWEILFYKELYKRGIKTIPQYPLEKYRLDLAIINGDRKLDIEVDGVRYHQNWDGELCRRDMIRNSRIQELGWDVKRFWVYQIRDNLESCVAEIENWIAKR